ncbi:MAG: hypothetical protein MJZ79_00045 [Paludibacteraceae bacterium]|nr:hypothetical protein [Paludibacteraceae bacterium]
MNYALDAVWWIFGIVEVLTFFIMTNYLSRHWSVDTFQPKRFAKNIFWSAFLIRVSYVLITYWFNILQTGDAFGYENADPMFYDQIGHDGAQWLSDGNWNLLDCFRQYYGLGSGRRHAVAFSDTGFPIFVSIVYWLSGNGDFSIFALRLMNCLLGAWTVLLMYRLSQRHFGESTARVVAVLCVLMPNLIYYCGTGLKEVLMVFLTVFFIERADHLMQERSFTIMPTLGLIAIAFYLFMIRNVLAITLILALLTALILSSQRVVKWGKRVALIGLSFCFLSIMIFQNTEIMREAQSIVEEGGSGQKENMEWRSTRKNADRIGNTFAKYAGAAVFAPMIFTIPFPTMVETPEQEVQKMIHGGNFCKNVMSFFTIMALFILLFRGEWRAHVLPLAILCGYLIVLVFSRFAQSERFHQPVLCFELMFAAYAISRIRERKIYMTWYSIWLGVMFLAAILWNWFKLAGREMV